MRLEPSRGFAIATIALAAVAAAVSGCGGGTGSAKFARHRPFAPGPTRACLTHVAVVAHADRVVIANKPQAHLGAVRLHLASGGVALLLFGRNRDDADALAQSFKHSKDAEKAESVNNVAVAWTHGVSDGEKSYVENCLRSSRTAAQLRAARVLAAERRRQAAQLREQLRQDEQAAGQEAKKLESNRALMVLLPKCTERATILDTELRRGWTLLKQDGYNMSLQSFGMKVAASIPPGLGRTRCADIMAALSVLIEHPSG